jgi:tetratricopeptide (TPR) repeat protein
MNLASIAVRFADAERALHAFAEAQQLANRNARVHRDCAIGLATLGYFALALRAYESALRLDGTLVGACIGASRVCAELGQAERSVQLAEQAVKLAPDNAYAWVELHRALLVVDTTRTLLAAQRAAVCAPQDPWCVALLAGITGICTTVSAAHQVVQMAQSQQGAAHGLQSAVLYALERGAGRDVHRFNAKTAVQLYSLEQCVLQGPVLEFGVRYAISTRTLASREGTTVVAFDSFEGLPEAWAGQSAGLFSTRGQLPQVPANVQLVKGWFADTLPRYVRDELRQPPKLLHIDSDLYASAWTVLSTLAPWIRPGCVLLFDEFLQNEHWQQDEYRALHDAVTTFGLTVEPLVLSWVTGQAAFCVR